MPNTLACEHCLTPDGWVRDALIEWDAAGIVTRVASGEAAGARGIVIPGMPNGHSHAFQRALAGHGERRAGQDTFWSWREAMYRLAASVTAEDMYLIARQAYAEMLSGGYTSVLEFQYLHHAVDGTPGSEMADALVRAAADAGIAITLVPVCYVTGGFNETARPGQSRFVHRDVDSFLAFLSQLRSLGVRMGAAAHSLRAVPSELLADLTAGARELLGGDCPMHIHVAEQQREVDECQAHTGRRPIELLADSIELDSHWNLVHATHALDHELDLIAESGARVVLCPLTEGYLGDGVFPAVAYKERGGQLAIGTDSDVRLDAIEELRWLEYGQRLRDKARARLADADGLGTVLWRDTAAAGARAVFRSCRGAGGVIGVDAYADLLLLDADAPQLAGLAPARAMDALLTAGDSRCIAETWVAGRKIEPLDPAVTAAYAGAARRLLGAG